jgi:predicted pyridoxine 5'-phosphate oxidase superfamily flavin-nucleotide-binding protein
MILIEPVRAFLEKPLIARIAVIDTDGYPHVIPIWFARDGDDVIFFSSRAARKIKYVRANPKGALTIGGNLYGSEGYLLKGEFSVEVDPGHTWLKEITYRYEPREVADRHVVEWATDDIIVLRFRPHKVIKI